MTANELEVLLTAAMLLALPVIAMCYWRSNRAISWGALGLCLLIPEAASERPNGALLHLIMAITAVIVTLQLWIDALKQRQQAREEAAAAQQAPVDLLPEDAAEVRAARDEVRAPAAAPWTAGYPGAPQPAGMGLHFLRRRHETHGKHEGRRP